MHSLNWLELLFMVPLTILGLTLHGWIQAIIAKANGDSSVSELKRDRFNPIYHINISGSILLFFCGFGWHKPLIYDKDKLRNGRIIEILIALVGPLTHLPIVLLSLIIYKTIGVDANTIIRGLLYYGSLANIILFTASLLPIPPFDGFNIFVSLSKEKYIKCHTFVIKWLSTALFILLLGETFSKIPFLPFFDLFLRFQDHLISIF